MASDPQRPLAGLDHVHVDAVCDGLFLTLVFEHHYINRSSAPAELLYSFPIPSAATLLDFDARIAAVALDPALESGAEDAYEDALAAGDLAAMVEQRAPGYCVASVGPIPAGETAVLRLRTGQLLEVVGGLGRIAIPGVASYPEGSLLGLDAGPAGIPAASFHAEHPVTLTLDLEGSATIAGVSSPTHALTIAAQDGGKRVSLATSAAFDRDIVILLDGLPATDGAMLRDERGAIAVAAFHGDSATDRAFANVAVLIDASGALAGATDALPDLVSWLCAELEPGDRISIVRIGRTAAFLLAPMTVSDTSYPPQHFDRITADLGDIPMGGHLPVLDLGARTDFLLLTDGQTRTAEAVAVLAERERHRLFVLALGSSPNEAWLRPRAEASGGAYVALAPEESPDHAVNVMLGATVVPPSPLGALDWVRGSQAVSPSWMVAPPSARAGHRVHVVAGFEAEVPEALSSGNVRCTLATDTRPSGSYEILAAQRLAHLAGDERADWASRHNLAVRTRAWIGRAPQARTSAEPARMTVVPQMVPAGWRGLGTPAPIPDRPTPPPAPPRAAGRGGSSGTAPADRPARRRLSQPLSRRSVSAEARGISGIRNRKVRRRPARLPRAARPSLQINLIS